jgi:hypothetical protein
MDTVKNLDPKAFIIAYEPRNIHGGFWVKGVRKRKLKAYEPEQLEVHKPFFFHSVETICNCFFIFNSKLFAHLSYHLLFLRDLLQLPVVLVHKLSVYVYVHP